MSLNEKMMKLCFNLFPGKAHQLGKNTITVFFLLYLCLYEKKVSSN